jgi:glycerate kinase
LEHGAKKLWLCIGGTATVDGGCGLMQALGFAFIGDAGQLPHPCCPTDLESLTAIQCPDTLPQITGLVDTMVPLLGDEGAARVFASQKGATPEQVELLESTMHRIADVLDPRAGHRLTPGAGAGGGMGFAVCAMGGTLRRGSDAVLEALGLPAALNDIDLVLTGEGCMDRQTATGKAPAAIAAAAAAAGIECIGIAGRLDKGADAMLSEGLFSAIDSLADRCGIERAMSEPAVCLREAAAAMLHQY